MSKVINVGDLVLVDGKVGQVRYQTDDGWYGAALLNEGGRVDEWQESQLQPVDPKTAAHHAVGR